MMRQITKLADRMLTRLVPGATAAACGECVTTSVHYGGPCPSEFYSRQVCCTYWMANICHKVCNVYC
jgi:hypothetical protein